MDPETIGVKAAGESLSILIDRVDADGQEFVITRWGKPAAVLVNVGKLADLREALALKEGES